jgi:hypothetical protein
VETIPLRVAQVVPGWIEEEERTRKNTGINIFFLTLSPSPLQGEGYNFD